MLPTPIGFITETLTNGQVLTLWELPMGNWEKAFYHFNRALMLGGLVEQEKGRQMMAGQIYLDLKIPEVLVEVHAGLLLCGISEGQLQLLTHRQIQYLIAQRQETEPDGTVKLLPGKLYELNMVLTIRPEPEKKKEVKSPSFSFLTWPMNMWSVIRRRKPIP